MSGRDDGAAAPGYRPCAAIVLFDRSGRVLVGDRVDVAGAAWQLPQGGIDAGESAAEAARRELAEEIGTDRAEVVAESRAWHCYDFPAGAAAARWGGRYRGQRVKGVALRFTGDDDDIDLATAEPEFRAWKWVALEEVPGLAVDFKRPLYEALAAEFRPLRDEIAGRC